MKNILSILFMTLCILSQWSCSSEDDNPSIEVKMRTASISQDAEVDAATTTLLTLSYNVRVAVNPSVNITLNGQKVDARTSTKAALDIEIPLSLKDGTEYTVNVPAGAIVAKDDSKSSAATYTLKFKTKEVNKQPEDGPMDEANKAVWMARAMGWGWNLGNHFDTGANEDANKNPIDFQKPKWGFWDGSTPTESLYKNLAKMGAKTVRMPVTWGVWQVNDGEYTINSNYMATVEQNVQWALNAGLYVVLNTHHDEYWQDIITAVANKAVNKTIEDRLTKTWTQIANRFKDCDDHLIFETMNEIHDESWGWKGGYNYKPVYTMMNEWNKVCVDAIRATGGKNSTRWIGIPGFCANPSFTLDYITIPNNDPRIMVAVHSYDPFNFCTEGSVQKWGHKFRGNDNDEKQVHDLFKKLYNKFIANNIPCYMGEYGVVARKAKADEKYREYYLEYFTRCAYLYNIPMMLWDNNSTSGEVFYFINHNDGTYYNQSLVDMMIKAGTSTDENYTLQSIYDNAK